MCPELTPLAAILRAHWLELPTPSSQLAVEQLAGFYRDEAHRVLTGSRTSVECQAWLQQQQRCITWLSDELCESLDNDTLLSQMADKTGRGYWLHTLEELLNHFRRRFPGWFDDEQLMTRAGGLFWGTALTTKLAAIENRCNAMEDTSLMDLCDCYVQRLQAGRQPAWRLGTYFNKLLDKLDAALDHCEQQKSLIPVVLVFCRMNANSHAITQCCISLLTDAQERSIATYHQLLLTLTTTTMVDVGLFPTRISLQATLITAIGSAIAHQPEPVFAPIATARVATRWTVDELACLAHLLVASGDMTPPNLGEFLNTFADMFSTARAATISRESFRIKYYQIERRSATAVRDKLLLLAKQTKEVL